MVQHVNSMTINQHSQASRSSPAVEAVARPQRAHLAGGGMREHAAEAARHPVEVQGVAIVGSEARRRGVGDDEALDLGDERGLHDGSR